MGHFAAEQPWLRRGPDLLVGCGNLRSAEQILISATCTCRWLPSIHWQEILPTLRQNPAESAPRTVSSCASWHEFGVTKASSLSLCLKLLLWNDKDTWRLFQLCDNAITRICAQSGFWPRILCPGFVPLGLILTAVSSRRGPCPLVIPASSHVRRLRDAVRSVGAHLASAHSVAAAKEWDPDSSQPLVIKHGFAGNFQICRCFSHSNPICIGFSIARFDYQRVSLFLNIYQYSLSRNYVMSPIGVGAVCISEMPYFRSDA